MDEVKASNAHNFLTMYENLTEYGLTISPRGQKVKEIEDYTLNLNAGESCLTSFKARNMNLNYAVNEFLWYLRGDKYDRSIENHASAWPKIIQPGLFYYSNYGQYMFGKGQGIKWVISELQHDMDSRRAAFPLLAREHCFKENKDMVCTYSMSFRIRNSRLNMTVNMRSNDAIFGTTNDVFAFWMTYKLVYAILKKGYPLLEPGTYCHRVDSLHIYERHWEMLDNLIQGGISEYEKIDVPNPTFEEAMNLINGKSILPVIGDFISWLTQNSASN